MTQSTREAAPDAAVAAADLDVFVTWMVRGSSTRDLSLTTISTLSELERAGPVRLSELAGRASVAQPSMTALVGRLVRDGLADRSDDPKDGRAVVVGITDRGRTLLAERRRRRVAALAALVERTDSADRDLIAAAAPALARLAERALTTDPGSPSGTTTQQETAS